jgi:hypothetical protein
LLRYLALGIPKFSPSCFSSGNFMPCRSGSINRIKEKHKGLRPTALRRFCAAIVQQI